MVYPPKWRQEHDPAKVEGLIRAFPFAHFFTSTEGAQCVTRLPFAVDVEEGEVRRLRAHMNAQNPQSSLLDNSDALIAFSGPDTYVSPNWRTVQDRGATWDYTAVHVWGAVRVRDDREFFDRLITDLAAASEVRFEGVSEKPNWSLKDVTEEYIESRRPNICAFEVEVSRIEAIAKLHQNFPEADARSVARHLSKSDNEKSRDVGALIAEGLEK